MPTAFSLEDLARDLLDIAAMEFAEFGQVSAKVVGFRDDHLYIIPLRFPLPDDMDDLEAKLLTLKIATTMLCVLDVEVAAHLCEIWYVEAPPDVEPDLAVPPSQRSDRREAVAIMIQDRNRVLATKREIIRPPTDDEKAKLGEIEPFHDAQPRQGRDLMDWSWITPSHRTSAMMMLATMDILSNKDTIH